MITNFKIIKQNNTCLVPVAYNSYLYNFEIGNAIPIYENSVNITDSYIENLCENLNVLNKTTDILILDFKNIISCNRGIEKLKDLPLFNNMFIVNVTSDINTSILERLLVCIPDLKRVNLSEQEFILCVGDQNPGINSYYVERIYQKHILTVLQKNDVVHKKDTISLFLDSSGIYSNTYLYINKIFYSYEAYMYICYQLADKISDDENFNRIDALVSTSKTGAIIASIVGRMLNKKTIHFLEIGPKFQYLKKQSIDKIRKDKEYYIISDFICLGTEIRLINAIIDCLGGSILGGIAVASYISLNKSEYNQSIFKSITSLTTITDYEINYEICGKNKE